MTDKDITEFLHNSGIAIRGSNSTQYVLDCPSCGKEGKVYMGRANGIWDCKSCAAKGNIHTYKKAVPAQEAGLLSKSTMAHYEQLIRQDARAKAYVQARGYTKDVIIAGHIGCNESGHISIPYLDDAGNPYCFKYRNLDYDNQMVAYEKSKAQNIETKRPIKWYTVGQPKLFKIGKLDPAQPLIITEGEWDAMILWQLGFKNVAAAPGATNKVWVDEVKDFKKIYIVFDNDEAGRTGGFDLASRLGLSKCYNVKLPSEYKDVNEAYLANKQLDFKRLIESAEMFPVSGISKTDRFDDLVMYDLMNPDKLKGYATGYAKLDKITGGFAEQELRVVSGLTSTGKTTWVMNEMLIYARMGIPIAIWSLESPVKKVIKDMLATMAPKPLPTMGEDEIRDLLKELNKLPIYFFDSRNFEEHFTVQKFKELVKQTRDRYGVKFVVLDDLDFLVNSGSKYATEVEIVSQLMTELKTLSNTLNVHAIVIAHIVKNVNEGIPRMRDIRGSGAISQRADYVQIIHRETAPDADEELKADVIVAIEKNRLGGDTGIVNYKFDKQRRTYREI